MPIDKLKLQQQLMEGAKEEDVKATIDASDAEDGVAGDADDVVEELEIIDYAGKSVPEMSESEKKAYAVSQGWRPKEEWKGDTSGWTDFDEFAEKKQNVHIRLEKAEKANEETLKVLSRQEELHKKTLERQEARYKKELETKDKELEAAKKAAKEDLDFDKYEEINKEQAEVKQEIKEIDDGKKESIETTPRIPEADMNILKDWKSRNDWYDNDIMLTAEADKLIPYIYARHKDKPLTERLRILQNEIRRKFPDEFRNKNQDRQSVDAGGERNNGAPRSQAKKFGYNDLDATDKMLYDRYKKSNWGLRGKQITPERVKASEDDFFAEIKVEYDSEKTKRLQN